MTLEWIHPGDHVMVEGEGPYAVVGIQSTFPLTDALKKGDPVQVRAVVEREDGARASASLRSCTRVGDTKRGGDSGFAITEKFEYLVWVSVWSCRTTYAAQLSAGAIAHIDCHFDKIRLN